MKLTRTDWNEKAQTLFLDHLRRYPLMQLQDMYKLIHQAAFGSEHAIENTQAALRFLREEWETMGEGPQEPLRDPISADGDIIRVHLRTYSAAGGCIETFHRAFMETARTCRGDARVADRYLACLLDEFVNERYSRRRYVYQGIGIHGRLVVSLAPSSLPESLLLSLNIDSHRSGWDLELTPLLGIGDTYRPRE